MFDSSPATKFITEDLSNVSSLAAINISNISKDSLLNLSPSTTEQPLSSIDDIKLLDFIFTAKGKDYFKIWITNLALTIVTLGIYYPWAKARRQRYFWAHTVVGGHALAFHGRAQSMFKGYAIAAILSGLYYGVSKVSPEYGAGMLIFLALIYPILFRASLRFLLLNTSWRGLRFKFNASVKQAYQYLASSIIVSGLLAVIPIVLVFMYGELVDEVNNEINWSSYTPALISSLLVIIFGVPIAYFYLKKFQKDFYTFANLQTTLRANAWGFFKILFKTIAIGILLFIILGIFFYIYSEVQDFYVQNYDGKYEYLLNTLESVLIFLSYFLIYVVIKSYFNSRHFNFFWGNIFADNLKLSANLKVLPLILLDSKNWILIILSLGLYYPFAKIASTKMQIESLSILSSIDFDQLVNEVSNEKENNLGQALTDLFDFDFGF